MGEHRKKLRATSFTFTLYMTIVPFFEWVLGKRSGNLHECVVTEGRLFQYLGNCKFFVRSPQVYHGIRIQPMRLQCTDCPIFIFFPGGVCPNIKVYTWFVPIRLAKWEKGTVQYILQYFYRVTMLENMQNFQMNRVVKDTESLIRIYTEISHVGRMELNKGDTAWLQPSYSITGPTCM